MKKNQSGFGVVGIVLIIVVVAMLGFAGWRVLTKKNGTSSENQQSVQETTRSNSTTQQNKTQASSVTWMLTGTGYQADGEAPSCPAKIVSEFPVDITKVTSVLYPGQVRGTDYKPHGGMRFDTSADSGITVKAPFDGVVMNGAAYQADVPGHDVNYGFDIMNDCGIMYRIGHLYTLSPEFAEIAKAFPAATSTDSRTTNVSGNIRIKAGSIIATAVGTPSNKSTFIDWGMYDWNTPNAKATDSDWLKDPKHSTPLATHAICWFDQLKSEDKTIIKGLPAADSISGKNSDYCY